MDKQIVISIKTIFLTFLLIFAGYVLFRLGPILALLLIATLVVFSIEPLIQKISAIKIFKKRLGRNFAVIFSYIITAALLIVALIQVIPPITSQLTKLFDYDYLVGLAESLESELGLSVADVVPTDWFSGEKSIFSTAKSVFVSFISVVSVFFLSVFMSLEWPSLKNNIIELLPPRAGRKAREVIDEIQISIAHWLKGQLTLMFVVGLFSFLGLWIMGVDYPLALGIISGLFEIVPNFGPFLAALCAFIVGFAESPIKGLGAVILYIIIQQLENNLLVPKIMQKVSGFSPLIILLALLIGARLFGIIGAVLAIPMTMVAIIIIRRVLSTTEN